MTDRTGLARVLSDADAFLITASNGLSATEGFHIFADDSSFNELFGDMARRYGIRSILDGLSARWSSQEEKWAFLSRLIDRYYNGYTASEEMGNLKDLIGNRPYFILTTNVEGHFVKAGFDASRIYEVEGSILYMRCSRGCHDTLYPTSEAASKMACRQKDCKVPEDLIPRCQHCGAPMEIYSGFPPAPGISEAWGEFRRQYHGKNVAVIELGVGPRNRYLKAPVLDLIASEPGFSYVPVNLGESFVPGTLIDRTYPLDNGITEGLKVLRGLVREG